MFGLNRCGRVKPLLWDYAKGTLSNADKATVEAHLAKCPSCLTEVEGVRRAMDGLSDFAALSTPTAPADWSNLATRLATVPGARPEPKRRPVVLPVFRPSFALAGAVALAITGGVVWNATHKNPSPGVSVSGTHAVDAASVDKGTLAPQWEPFWRADNKHISVRVDTVFNGLPVAESCPLVITVRGIIQPKVVTLSAYYNGLYGVDNVTFKKQILLPPVGEVRRYFLYVAAHQLVDGSPTNSVNSYSVRLSGEGINISDSVHIAPPINDSNKNVCVLTDKMSGLKLSGREQLVGAEGTPILMHGEDQFLQYTACYLRPENAPDKVVGYNSIDYIVMGGGAEKLTPNQWQILRDWVKAGGSLILTDGALTAWGGSEEGREMSPVQLPEPVWRQLPMELPSPVKSLLPLPLPKETSALYATLKPGSASLTPVADNKTLFAARTLGLGRVLYVGFDPTQPTFLNWFGYRHHWRLLLERAAPNISTRQIASISEMTENQQLTYANNSGIGYVNTWTNTNPFTIQLPSTQSVLNVFLAYFVLAIPVTFVVLKRTRRMELAWATGPVLAVLFAGGLSLMTADLYRAKLSKRTTGLLIADAGGKQGRFSGYSEVFYPRAGQYGLTFPGNVEKISNASPSFGFTQPGSGNAMSILDKGNTTEGANITVGNLAFRRYWHTQRIDWGGVTMDLHYDARGHFVGTVRNDTGQTIAKPLIFRGTGKMRSRKDGSDNTYYEDPQYKFALLPDLPPGESTVDVETDQGSNIRLQKRGNLPLSYVINNYKRPTEGWIFTGRISGEKVAPTLGSWVGGDQSVTVLMSLPNLTDDMQEGGRK